MERKNEAASGDILKKSADFQQTLLLHKVLPFQKEHSWSKERRKEKVNKESQKTIENVKNT